MTPEPDPPADPPEDPPPADPPPEDPPADPPADPPSGDPAVSFRTQEEFDKRMERAERAMLKKHGISDPAQLAAILKERKELQEAEAERVKAAMTELERKDAELAERDVEIARLEEQASDAEFQSVVSDVCAEHDVKNRRYAAHLIHQRALDTPEGEEFSASDYMKELMEDPDQRAALGAPSVAVPAPVDTEPGDPNAPRPKPPPAGAGEPDDFDALKATKAEYDAYLASQGISVR